jgi:hypothetical protein
MKTVMTLPSFEEKVFTALQDRGAEYSIEIVKLVIGKSSIPVKKFLLECDYDEEDYYLILGVSETVQDSLY